MEVVAGVEDCFYLPDLIVNQTLEVEYQVKDVMTECLERLSTGPSGCMSSLDWPGILAQAQVGEPDEPENLLTLVIADRIPGLNSQLHPQVKFVPRTHHEYKTNFIKRKT